MRGEARAEKTEGGVLSSSSPRMMRKLILLPILVALIAASSALGDEPERLLWKFQSLSWYNRFSTNSTVGPIVLGPTAIFGGTYSYQNTTESKLAMVDLASGQARWRFERVGPIGPMAVNGSAIALGIKKRYGLTAVGRPALRRPASRGLPRRQASPIQPMGQC